MMDTVADATEKRKKKGTTAEKRERERTEILLQRGSNKISI